jgi:hydrogenase expression/formation protein HypC
MCLGIPRRVLSTDGLVAQCEAADGERATVDLSLVGAQEPGTWILDYLGAAREVLDPDTADQISRALAGLRSIMAGGALGDAFADLEAREPSLPPHLEAARKAGAKTA